MNKLTICIIVATARSRYESLKKHTQDELKHTIDAMLDTETRVEYLFLFYCLFVDEVYHVCILFSLQMSACFW